jgi:hypothetical protein
MNVLEEHLKALTRCPHCSASIDFVAEASAHYGRLRCRNQACSYLVYFYNSTFFGNYRIWVHGTTDSRLRLRIGPVFLFDCIEDDENNLSDLDGLIG